MDLSLKDKVVVVTGGASGIGEAIVRSFAAEGARVVIVARRAEQAVALVGELTAHGQRVECVAVELTDTPACRAAIETVVSRHGRLDVLVNNAAANDAVNLAGSVDEFRASLEKNLVQVFAMTHFAAPHLVKSKGTIVNIGSKVTDTGQGGTSGYAASKGALNALTREWAINLIEPGVRVNTVVPAEVMTPLYQRWFENTADPDASRRAVEQIIPLERRMTTGAEVADMVVFLASPRSSHTTGQIIYVDGGYVHLDRACTVDSLKAVLRPKTQPKKSNQ